jgi:hypothetical protein
MEKWRWKSRQTNGAYLPEETRGKLMAWILNRAGPRWGAGTTSTQADGLVGSQRACVDGDTSVWRDDELGELVPTCLRPDHKLEDDA